MQEVSLKTNDMVRFKPTDYGRKVFFEHVHGLMKKIWTPEKCVIPLDENGYARMTMWQFMNIFGPNMRNGNPDNPFVDDTVIVEVKQ